MACLYLRTLYPRGLHPPAAERFNMSCQFQVGEMSPDRRHRFDGRQWVAVQHKALTVQQPTITQDGAPQHN